VGIRRVAWVISWVLCALLLAACLDRVPDPPATRERLIRLKSFRSTDTSGAGLRCQVARSYIARTAGLALTRLANGAAAQKNRAARYRTSLSRAGNHSPPTDESVL
jgi:hypothetical protein